jgi:hypothetical protein
MKKTVISLIAAAAIWTGTTAYVGNQMEENLQAQIENSNQLNSNNGIKYKINSYQKNFLNSTAEIEIDFTNPEILALIQDTVKLPMVIKYNIEHGPLFFKNGLGFGAAKTHQEIPVSSLLTEEAKKEFLALIKDDIIIKSDMDISFTNNASYKASTSEVKIDKDGKSFHMAPLEIKGKHNLETYRGDAKIHVDSLELHEEGSKNGLTLQDLDINIEIDEFIEKAIMLGTIDFSIANLLIKDDTNPKLQNINLATHMHMMTKKESKETISTGFDGSVDFKDTKLPDNIPNLKNIHAKMNMNNIGIKGMLEFQKASKDMQEAQSKLLNKMQSSPSEEEMQKIFDEFGTLQQEMMNQIVHALNSMLVKDKTLIEYGLAIETKDNKESDADIKILYTGDIDFNGSLEEIAMKVQQQALNLVDLDVKIALDEEHIKTLPDAEMLKQQIQMGVAQGFIKEEKGKYILNGYYKNQELMVNDNNLTATVLPFFMMATQGGGF